MSECKKRITIFKESEAKRYDENICRLSKRAIEFLLKAEKSLAHLRKLKGANDYEEKCNCLLIQTTAIWKSRWLRSSGSAVAS